MKNKKTLTSPRTKAPVPAATRTEIKLPDFRLVTLTGFVLTLLLLVFSYNYFGSFFEMNDDPRYVMAMKGFASPQPYNNFVSAYLFTSDMYIYLYRQFPGIGWYGYTMFLMLWVALFNSYIVLYLFSKQRFNFLLFNILFLAFYFLLFFQNAYLINFTRPSLLATSTFILLLASLYLNREILKKQKWILVFPSLGFVFAHLTRLDAGHLGFVTGTICALVLIVQNEKILPFVLKYLSPVVVFLGVVYFYNGYKQSQNDNNKDFLEKTELIRQLIDYRNASAYAPKNKKDSISYDALINRRYCSDNNIITANFIRSLTDSSPLLERANQKKFDDEFGAFVKSFDGENKVLKNLFIGFLLLISIWLFSSFKQNLNGFLKYILLQLLFTGIFIFMCYLMKMPARVFHPLLVLLSFSNILFMFSTLRFAKNQFYLLLLIPLLLVLFSIPANTKANKEFLSGYKKYGRINTSMFTEMNERFTNTIFIPTNIRSWDMHNATDPIKEVNFKNNNCYVYLSIELSLAPETQDQLLDKFKTTDHAKLFQNICSMNNVVFLSSENYNNFLRRYYYYLYNQNYYFERVFTENSISYESTGLNYYRLKKLP